MFVSRDFAPILQKTNTYSGEQCSHFVRACHTKRKKLQPLEQWLLKYFNNCVFQGQMCIGLFGSIWLHFIKTDISGIYFLRLFFAVVILDGEPVCLSSATVCTSYNA